MGNSGGIVITKISDIKYNWKAIKENLISNFEKELNDPELNYFKNYSQNSLNECNRLPDTIENYTGDEIIELLSSFSSSDCPFNFRDEYIITPYGAYVRYDIDMLSNIFFKFADGELVKTWT